MFCVATAPAWARSAAGGLGASFGSGDSRAVEIGSEVLIDAGNGTAGTARQAEARPGIGAGRAPGLNVSDFAVRGRVVAISPSLDPERRSFKVTVRTNSGAVRLQDGEFVTIWIAGRRAEDVAIVPIIFMLGALAPYAQADGLTGIWTTLWQGAAVIGVLLIAGRYALPTLFAQAARTKSPEVFLAATLVVVIGASLATGMTGLSPGDAVRCGVG